MKDIIYAELKKVLKPQLLIVFLIFVLLYSIITSLMSFSSYEYYDGNGELLFTAKENLKETKKHSLTLDEQTLQDVVERKDKSLFAYNTSLVLLVARNYNKKVTELTTQDFQNFYQNRVNGVIEQAEEQAGLMHKTLGQEEVQYLRESANHLTTPIHLGYKEGWHSLNSDMGKVATLVLAFSSVLAIPIFGQSPKTKIKELCLATRNGKMLHYQARVIAGILLGLFIYFPSMLIFSIIRLTVLGLQGGSLSIQSSVLYFFSAWSVNYIEQFLINFNIGLLSILLMLSFILFFGALLEKMISTSVIVAFLWIFMIMPQTPEITHYFYGFLPYNMLDFADLYINNETYLILGKVLPRYIWIMIIACIFFILLMTLMEQYRPGF